MSAGECPVCHQSIGLRPSIICVSCGAALQSADGSSVALYEPIETVNVNIKKGE